MAGTVGTGTVGGGGGGGGAGGRKMDEDEERDAVFFRLESLGYRVGQGLVERLVLFFFPEFLSILGFSGLQFGRSPISSAMRISVALVHE